MPEAASPDPPRDALQRGAVRTLRRLYRRFGALSWRRRSLLVEAMFWLAFARGALVVVPFRHLASRFGTVHKPGDAAPAVLQSSDQSAIAQEVGWAVTRAARYVPFRAVCLPQAIAAKAMLDRRGVASVMHFGVAKTPGGPIDAHAWLNAGPVEVTGFPVAQSFVEMAYFL